MGKLGYVFAALLVVVLGTYALWPTPEITTVKLLTVDKPVEAWNSTVGTLTQKVTKERTLITIGTKTYDFATDTEKMNGVWSTLGSIAVLPAKVIDNIGAAQLPEYGVDGTHSVETADGTLRICWGGSGGQAYVWNSATRKLFSVDPNMLPGLDNAAKPVAKTQVLQMAGSPSRLTVDGLALIIQDGQWIPELFRNRPPFNPRVSALFGDLSRTSIDDLQGVQVFGLPVIGTVELSAIPGSPSSAGPFAVGPQPPRVITVYSSGVDGAIAITGYPAQRVDAARIAGLKAVFAAFRRDVLLDLFSSIGREDVLRVTVVRDGKSWWSLERRDKPPAVGGFFWDVVWPGGRESAPDNVVEQLGTLVSSTMVRDAALNPKGLEQLPAGAIRVTFQSDRPDGRPVEFALAAGDLLTPTHRARLADDGALLAALEPSHQLDNRLTRREPSRVAKVQRRFRDEPVPRDEVVVRSEGGTWARTYPKPATGGPPPVESAAMDRLVRAISAARMQETTLIAATMRDEASRALLANADFELDVRFAAVAGGQASNDETDLDLSAAQDWGIALKRDGTRWIGVDKDLGLRFVLDDDTVEEFRRPFEAGQVYPVVASVVNLVEMSGIGGTKTALRRDGVAWTVTIGTESAAPAEVVAVRRYFRTLGALTVPDGKTLDMRAPEPTPSEVVASITCTVPSVAGDPFATSEQLTLAILKPLANGTPVHVWSNRATSRFPRGRAIVPGAVVAELLPDPASFRK